MGERLDWLILASSELRQWDQEIQAFIGWCASGRTPAREALIAYNELRVKRERLLIRFDQYLRQFRDADMKAAGIDVQTTLPLPQRAVLTGIVRADDPNPHLNGKTPPESV